MRNKECESREKKELGSRISLSHSLFLIPYFSVSQANPLDVR